MSYALILCILSGASDDEPALLAAAELAKREGAKLRVVPSLPLSDAVVWADTFGATFIAANTLEEVASGQARLRTDMAGLIDNLCRRLDLENGKDIVFVDDRSPPWMVLAREAPLADLVVAGHATTQLAGFWGGLPGETLMEIRKPLLIVRAPQTIEGGCVAIAWDGSLPAGHAVQGAIPILKAASRVVILQDPEGLSAEEKKAADPRRLIDYLAHRGVTNVEVAKASGRREGKALAAAAEEHNAAVLVAGAFGHSRLGESLAGGATRAFVGAKDGPHLLLAH